MKKSTTSTNTQEMSLSTSSFEYTFLKFGFCSILLYFIGLFINHGPHNILITLNGLLGLIYISMAPAKRLKDYKEHRYFFLALVGYVLFYILFNFYHLSTQNDLMFAFERVRWVVFAIVLFPMVSQIAKKKVYKDPSLLKVKYVFFTLILILAGLIFSDSISRVLYAQPSAAAWFSNLSSNYYTRASWTYNPIPFSQLSFFACVALLLTSWQGWHKNKSLALTSLALSSGMLTVTVLTQTRATWIGILVFSACIFGLHKSSRKYIAGLACFTLLAIFASGENDLTNRLKSISSTTTFSNVYRLEHWTANLKLARANLAMGVGYAENRKPAVIDPYLKKFTKKTHLLYGHSHNEYLDVLSATGLVAFLLFIFVFAYPVLLILRSQYKRHLPAAISVAFLCFMYSSAFFDLIALTSWSVVITSWYVCLLYQDIKNEDHLRV